MTSQGTSDGALTRSLVDAVELLQWLQQLEAREGIIAATGDTLAECLRRGGRILSCGNGGSMRDAMHFAQELSCHFRSKRRALAAQAISDPSYLTCAANDEGFDSVFAPGVEAGARQNRTPADRADRAAPLRGRLTDCRREASTRQARLRRRNATPLRSCAESQ